MTGVVMHYALFGQIPPLDSQGRPKQFMAIVFTTHAIVVPSLTLSLC